MSFSFCNIVGIHSDMNNIITALVFVCTFLLLVYNTRRPKGVPPGPVLYPVIGNIASLVGADMFTTLSRLRQKYGDIFGLYIGKELTIFLNGYDVIHDALVKKGSLFKYRPTSIFSKKIIKRPIVIWGNGQHWKDYKTCIQKALQELCFSNGGKHVESIINKEISYLVDTMQGIDKPVDIDNYVSVSVANVVLTLIYKRRFDFEDETLLKILKYITDGANDYAKLSVIVNCFPFLSYFPGDIFKEKLHENNLNYAFNIIRPSTDTIRLNVNDNLDSLAGLYMKQIQDMKQMDRENLLTESNLDMTCYELVCAGSETSGTTLRWIMLYLIRDRNIQSKMFQEIENTIGREAKPTLKDSKLLPYVQAVILEGIRIASAAPFAIPHAVSRDIVFRGYDIPKNSTVMINIDSCLKDPLIWKDPDVFRAERFLNVDGTELLVPKEFIPFSLGPRSCPGESLARMELFLFLTTLVQKFEFHPARADCIPVVKGKLGMTWSPDSFLMRIHKR